MRERLAEMRQLKVTNYGTMVKMTIGDRDWLCDQLDAALAWLDKFDLNAKEDAITVGDMRKRIHSLEAERDAAFDEGVDAAAQEVGNYCSCTDDQATPEQIENHQCPAEKAIRALKRGQKEKCDEIVK